MVDRAVLATLFLCLAVATVSAAGGQWTNIGPDGGTITALAVHPVDPRTMFAGLAGNGLYKSTDGGTSWKLMNTGVPTNASVSEILISRVAPGTMYVLTGKIYKTTDGGAAWRLVQVTTSGEVIECLAMNANTGQVLYAGEWNEAKERTGIYKTSDGGDSWMPVNTGLPADVYDVPYIFVDSRVDEETLFANVVYYDKNIDYYNAMIFKSTDGGSTWAAIVLPLSSGSYLLYVPSLIVSASSSRTLYAGVEWYDAENISRAAVLASYDSGASWQQLTSGLPKMQQAPEIAMDPGNPSILYLGANWSVYKSRNAGIAWAPLTKGLPSSGIWANCFAFDRVNSSRLYTGLTGYGLYLSTNAGQSWSPSNGGIRRATTTSMAVNPRMTSTIYAAIYPSGIKRSTDGGTTWTTHGSGLPPDTIRSLVLDPRNPSTLYAGTESRGVYKSLDGGATWQPKNKGFDWKRVISKVVVDPVTPNTVYLASDAGVIRSVDGGQKWMNLSSDYFISATALAIDPRTPSILYVGAWNEPSVYKSVDGGKAWQDCDLPLSGSGSPYTSSIVIDPTTPSTLYAAVHERGIFKSTDGGASWRKSSAGLPKGDTEPRVRALWMDPNQPATLYAGMGGFLGRSGVWISLNGGKNWTPTSAGLSSNPYVRFLDASPTAPTAVYAGISGEGIFKRTLTASTDNVIRPDGE